MDWVALGELLTLLAIGLLTPGPNALTCFGHSGLFGPRANIKLIAGMTIGFVTIELSVGLLVDAVSDSTAAMNVLHWIGMAFLGAMVVAMFRFDPASVKVENTIDGMLGLKVGIGMQFVNGKEWAFVIIMMSQFIEPLGGGMTGIATIIFVTLTTCLFAMILWTLAGARLNHLFTQEAAGKRIFQFCGFLLGLLWVAFLIQGPATGSTL
jgi:threonine/homoserine/homoserine lactone efflux protein